MALDILYFAWVREGIGLSSERVEPPIDVVDIAGLIGWLAGRSEGHARALADPSRPEGRDRPGFRRARRPYRRRARDCDLPAGHRRMIEARLQAAPFDAGAELARLGLLGGGGLASFTGIVRGDGGLTELFLEHHPAMTRPAMLGMAQGAMGRWDLLGVILIHRVGALMPGEPIVFVGTASRHRAAALESCAYLIDLLKTSAPFWKRETFADGSNRWVEARVEDDDAAARWRDGAE
jgi:molybdopterin synthase catalytic subunit